jgi:hypothetical protein
MSRTPIRWLAAIAALVCVMAIATSDTRAHSGQVTAQLMASEVLASDDAADVTFTIEVVNGGASAAAGVRVVFADGAEVTVGDVAGESTASSQSQRRIVARTTPSHNIPLEATLKYTSDGEAVEQSIILTVKVAQ